MGPPLSRLCGALEDTIFVVVTLRSRRCWGCHCVLGWPRVLELGQFLLLFYAEERIASTSTEVLGRVTRSISTEVFSQGGTSLGQMPRILMLTDN